ncbi:uncharacterized protein EV420DRAFT_1482057 [Desarmillaria tabescens]|uniref:Carboxymuconolactone decarboxylase-like domain-containing protein n=1 Tax=Armillaria tabescens TaxID=1929756 RepID=A0AA39N0K0_ARMTA|nr:uncharacterized protein EV420DRAFT_1482057 [Desarmillaria tabescens]KAK0452750.1 hypothetical protein EV420DRAFT_1482057 [Desarmillaria tabescens]
MADIATREFLAHLEALYPKQDEGGCHNLPEAVPEVFKYALEGLKTHEERLLLARKLRDALYKSGMLSGFPSCIPQYLANCVMLNLSEFFSTTFAYGHTYSFFDVVSPAETSFTMVAALIANDTPRQVDWHLRGSVRNGATLDEVKAVRQIATEGRQGIRCKVEE